MDEQEALEIVNEAIFQKEKRKLKDIEELIFKGSLQKHTYGKIADNSGYDEQHIKNEGAAFWKILSKVLGEKVGKNNFLGALERRQSPDTTQTQDFHKSNNLEEKINDLVAKVRLNIREIILDNCGTMKVSQPKKKPPKRKN
ncbi:hypothetical protein AFK68_29115 [Hydrocoleum sp. CS-953]|nr:hypothetical protein AFK68_29115 [Hydrocoleum sp. CS-953]